MWAVFGSLVATSLILDLALHREGRASSRAAAIAWSAIWIGVALAFGLWIGIARGRDDGEDFLAAYLMEKTLSIDNLFVFLVVFGRLRMSAAEQHRVLTWGILGALVFRAVFIGAGAAVLARWHSAIYVLGALLIASGVRAALPHREQAADGRLLRLLRDRLHLRSTFLVALITIELTDVLFAVDSVPAVFAISSDPFIVYTSNVFAILGLRALYLVLADLLARLHYMQAALAAILVLAGGKLLLSGLAHVPHLASFLAIGAILGITVALNVWRRGAAR